MKNINVKSFGAVLLALATGHCLAAQPADVGEGTVFRSIFGARRSSATP